MIYHMEHLACLSSSSRARSVIKMVSCARGCLKKDFVARAGVFFECKAEGPEKLAGVVEPRRELFRT